MTCEVCGTRAEYDAGAWGWLCERHAEPGDERLTLERRVSYVRDYVSHARAENSLVGECIIMDLLRKAVEALGSPPPGVHLLHPWCSAYYELREDVVEIMQSIGGKSGS